MDNHLVFRLGSRSELTLMTPERTLRCYPGDLHALTAADVTLIADLLIILPGPWYSSKEIILRVLWCNNKETILPGPWYSSREPALPGL